MQSLCPRTHPQTQLQSFVQVQGCDTEMVHPFGMWARFSKVVKVLIVHG